MTPGDDIHPNDRAVLYDLVDGRLAPRAADEVRRRLDDEPELRAAYDQILDLRRRVAALPTRPLPADFLERVRQKAGFPAAAAPLVTGPAAVAVAPGRSDGQPVATPSVPSGAGAVREGGPGIDSSTGPASGANSASAGGTGGAGAPPLGPVLSFARYAYGIAALLVVALGATFWMAMRKETANESPAEVARERAAQSGREEPAKPSGGADDRESNAEGASKDGATGTLGPPPTSVVAGASRPVHFPGLPPGLRTPSDDPNDAHPPEAPIPLGGPRPTPPASTPGPTGTPPPDAGLIAPSVTAMSEGSRAESTPTVGRRGGAAPGGKSGRDLLHLAAEGDDRVLVVYADSLDVARAEVAILVDDARAGRRLDAHRVAAFARDGTESSDQADKKAGAATAGESGGASLGAFVVELDAPAFERLTRSLAGAVSDSPSADSGEKRKDRESGAGKAEPPVPEAKKLDAGAPTAPAPSSKPAAEEPSPPPSPPSPHSPAPDTIPAPVPAPPSAPSPRVTQAPPPGAPVAPPEPMVPPGESGAGGGGEGGKQPEADGRAVPDPTAGPAPKAAPIRRVRIVVFPSR